MIQKINFDLSPLGFCQGEEREPYYCTPKNAKIIGWAGVDGIHYCTIPQFGEMIFAVSPMNFGDCVHPIAYHFEDLLRLLLSCVDMAALEQCYAWDEEQFQAFLHDCSPTAEQQEALQRIRQLGLTPIENAYAYVKALQAKFDLSKIPYTDDYDDPDMNAAAPERPEAWSVYFESGYFQKSKRNSRAGQEVTLNRSFCWADEHWYIPAAYLCSKGLVVDFCVKISPQRQKAFLDKWDFSKLDEASLTVDMRQQLDRENPLQIEFRPTISVNGKSLTAKSGSSLSWLPASCLPNGEQNPREAHALLQHYELDETQVWSFHRYSFPWSTTRKPSITSLSLKLERKADLIEGIHFRNPSVGDVISFVHPLSGVQYELTVIEYEPQILSAKSLASSAYEFPTYHTAMTYSVTPELPRGASLRDCLENDTPRLRIGCSDATDFDHTSEASCIGVIGGADGPTAILVASKPSAPQSAYRVALSALHFAPQQEIEWKILFREKRIRDIQVELLS